MRLKYINALQFVVAAAVIASAVTLSATPAPAAEDPDKAVRKALVERTKRFCDAVVPEWLASGSGIAEPAFRAVVADCYLSHARLEILGEANGIAIADTALSELPAALLSQETGLSLDVYRPLAGRTLRSPAEGK
jgi:hypothetical protein